MIIIKVNDYINVIIMIKVNDNRNETVADR